MIDPREVRKHASNSDERPIRNAARRRRAAAPVVLVVLVVGLSTAGSVQAQGSTIASCVPAFDGFALEEGSNMTYGEQPQRGVVEGIVTCESQQPPEDEVRVLITARFDSAAVLATLDESSYRFTRNATDFGRAATYSFSAGLTWGLNATDDAPSAANLTVTAVLFRDGRRGADDDIMLSFTLGPSDTTMNPIVEDVGPEQEGAPAPPLALIIGSLAGIAGAGRMRGFWRR